MTQNEIAVKGEIMEAWEKSAEIVLGALKLSISSLENPTHPRNLEFHAEFMADPLKHAVRLLERIEKLELEMNSRGRDRK